MIRFISIISVGAALMLAAPFSETAAADRFSFNYIILWD
jgi:hypothetical protein